ncbi:hypothetical protein [Streptomyces sp. NBC_00353]
MRDERSGEPVLLGSLGLPAGPVHAALRPAGREAADGMLAAYERLAVV